MKEILLLLAASNAVSDFFATKQGEFVGQVSRYLRKLDTFLDSDDGLQSHGCWCAKLKNNDGVIKRLGGDPTDELDMLCKTWYKKRHCIKLAGGFCEGENYLDYSVDLVDDNGKLKIADQGTLHCKNAGSRCQKEICLIDHEFITEIRKLRRLKVIPSDQCFPDSSNSVKIRDSMRDISSYSPDLHLSHQFCTGNAPNVEIKKGSPEPTDCNTSVSEIYNRFVPTYMELCKSMNQSTPIHSGLF